MNVNDKEVIQACISLMGSCLQNEGNGVDLDINTHKGIAHCKFDFSIDLKNQEDD